MVDLTTLKGFEWDSGNREKNWDEHQVTWSECEEACFNIPLLLDPDTAHSQTVLRYFVLGQTNAGRLLFIVFTVRKKKIRVISARDISKKERAINEPANS